MFTPDHFISTDFHTWIVWLIWLTRVRLGYRVSFKYFLLLLHLKFWKAFSLPRRLSYFGLSIVSLFICVSPFCLFHLFLWESGVFLMWYFNCVGFVSETLFCYTYFFHARFNISILFRWRFYCTKFFWKYLAIIVWGILSTCQSYICTVNIF